MTQSSRKQLARWVLCAFLLTFLVARMLVILIMLRRIPDLFLHLGGSHIHHLNYGIFLLAGLGAWLLLAPPTGHARIVAAALYGVGMALTFDEFGMWVHFGGGYWQRASFDAVAVVASVLALLAVAPDWRGLRVGHLLVLLLVLSSIGAFTWLLIKSLNRAEASWDPVLRQLEQAGPR